MQFSSYFSKGKPKGCFVNTEGDQKVRGLTQMESIIRLRSTWIFRLSPSDWQCTWRHDAPMQLSPPRRTISEGPQNRHLRPRSPRYYRRISAHVDVFLNLETDGNSWEPGPGNMGGDRPIRSLHL